MTPPTTAATRMLGVHIDPVRFEVIRNALIAITEEMGATLRRAAYSANVKTRGDFSCSCLAPGDGQGYRPDNCPRTHVTSGSDNLMRVGVHSASDMEAAGRLASARRRRSLPTFADTRNG